MEESCTATGDGAREEELRSLREALASRGELVGAITHMIRGLLNGADGGLYLLQSGLKRGEQDRVDQGLAMVKRNLAKLRNAAGVLYYVKDRELDWQPLVLSEVTEAAVKAAAGPASLSSVRVEASPGGFEGDPNAIQALLVGLLEFALDPPAEGAVIRGYGEGDEVHFVLFFYGHGLDEENRARVFSRAYAPRPGDRTVLGLFTAEKLARAHGGSLEIGEVPGGGTRFLVRLPRVRGGGAAP